MKGSREKDRKAAQTCIAIISSHVPLNDSEKRLLFAIVNEIRLAFDLEGSSKPGLLVDDASDAPEVWIW
jgi:hypothetical protein